jgi:hypothetical protein
MDRTLLERNIQELLSSLGNRGYYMYRIGTKPPNYHYGVRRPEDVSPVDSVLLTNPVEILTNPWACGALLFSAYQLAGAPEN